MITAKRLFLELDHKDPIAEVKILNTQINFDFVVYNNISLSKLYATVLQELSKITMPVVFNEPISFLQRIVEYMEYSYLLERASVCETPEERMAVSRIAHT